MDTPPSPDYWDRMQQALGTPTTGSPFPSPPGSPPGSPRGSPPGSPPGSPGKI